MSSEKTTTLMFDITLRQPACTLLQAVHGCDSRSQEFRLFSSDTWLLTHTPGMRKIAGTPAQWKQVADKANGHLPQ